MTAAAAGALARAPAVERWVVRESVLSLEEPLVVGVLNVTPDSFSDGGLFLDPSRATEQALRLVEEGAGAIDVGGESTRPGAAPVSAAEERDRVLPVIRALARELDVPISIDTRKSAVAEAALGEGAAIVNDVSALGDPEMAGLVGRSGAGLVLMHMRGTPQTMQRNPHYDDVATEVRNELGEALKVAVDTGIDAERIVLDPGIGFAKTLSHNLELLARLGELRSLGRPIMAGVSRKAFIGTLLEGIPPHERGVGTAAACVMALLSGARIFRVHDVRSVREALVVAQAIRLAAPDRSP